MIKPKIFIGSSVEGLNIAYAIQENLDHSSIVTIWDQGIFQLTSTALDDLIVALKNTEFGIFIFSPDDISKIRDEKFKTTRDNVIFELGLFIGYLGKNRVSYVIPRNVKDFHLPSDLTGITPGTFNNERPDGNLRAALGPFCNQIKGIIEKSTIICLAEFQDDSFEAKRLIIGKPDYWEFLLTLELLKPHIKAIKDKISEIDQNLVFVHSKKMDLIEFLNWISEQNEDLLLLAESFKNNYLLFQNAWGEPGQEGDELKIKEVVNRMVEFSNKAMDWELSIKSIMPPEEIKDLKELMKGWSHTIIDTVLEFHSRLVLYFDSGEKPKGMVDFEFIFVAPKNLAAFNQRIEYYN